MPTSDKPAAHDAAALAQFERRLLEERRLALRELGTLSEVLGATDEARDGDLSTYPFHMADQGTDAMEQEKSLLLASQEGRLLLQIDEALRHLYRSPETFGTCARCGRRIDAARLDAIPHARLCISCQQQAESAAAAPRAAAAVDDEDVAP